MRIRLTVGDSVAFDLELLLDGGAVLVVLAGLDDFIGKGFNDVLSVLEGLISGMDSQEVKGLVDSSEGRNIDGLSLNSTARSDSGGVFTGTRVADGIDQNLKGVLGGLKGDQLESLSNDADSFELLSVVASVEVDSSDESLDEGASGFSEPSDLPSSGGVGQENSGLNGVD